MLRLTLADLHARIHVSGLYIGTQGRHEKVASGGLRAVMCLPMSNYQATCTQKAGGLTWVQALPAPLVLHLLHFHPHHFLHYPLQRRLAADFQGIALSEGGSKNVRQSVPAPTSLCQE